MVCEIAAVGVGGEVSEVGPGLVSWRQRRGGPVRLRYTIFDLSTWLWDGVCAYTIVIFSVFSRGVHYLFPVVSQTHIDRLGGGALGSLDTCVVCTHILEPAVLRPVLCLTVLREISLFLFREFEFSGEGVRC